MADRRPVPGAPGFYVRISDALTSAVVFLGIATDEPGKGGIDCLGTGFLVAYDHVGFLVTARHVAKELHNSPFRVRMNKPDGTSGNLDADHIEWTYHPDENVDLAAILFHMSRPVHGYEAIYIPHTMIIDRYLTPGDGFGIGDMCYAVGLFRVLVGQKRNLPVVHAGNLALLPGDEKIPVRDWLHPQGKGTRHVEGYLVEMQSLSGLSGSPVFIRPCVDAIIDGFDGEGKTTPVPSRLPRHDIYLLGVWQAAWDAPPSEVIAMERGRGIQVPVGMGVVVPISKLLDVLEQPALKQAREEAKRLREEQEIAAAPSSIPRAAKSAPSTTADNPSHKEDFTRLVSAAARKKKRGD